VTLSPNYHFNFSFNEGSKNYVLIKSYSAKNKIIEMIYGVLNPEAGKFKIGGKLFDDLDRAGIRDDIMIIDQANFFGGTVTENLIGFINDEKRPELTEIFDALDLVGMADMIKALPDGLETKILPHGYPFTKSQLLSLQVAKAILANPKIILVRSDFEYISTSNRTACLKVLTNPAAKWTLLFFTQKNQKNIFDNYFAITRNTLKKFASKEEVLKELAQDE
jgi:ABC-type transport system involved in cytochrome bd biosynthesis fused ATPase/permease subunit